MNLRLIHLPGAPVLLLLVVLGAAILRQESRAPAQRHISLALLRPSIDTALAPTPPMGYRLSLRR